MVVLTFPDSNREQTSLTYCPLTLLALVRRASIYREEVIRKECMNRPARRINYPLYNSVSRLSGGEFPEISSNKFMCQNDWRAEHTYYRSSTCIESVARVEHSPNS